MLQNIWNPLRLINLKFNKNNFLTPFIPPLKSRCIMREVYFAHFVTIRPKQWQLFVTHWWNICQYQCPYDHQYLYILVKTWFFLWNKFRKSTNAIGMFSHEVAQECLLIHGYEYEYAMYPMCKRFSVSFTLHRLNAIYSVIKNICNQIIWVYFSHDPICFHSGRPEGKAQCHCGLHSHHRYLLSFPTPFLCHCILWVIIISFHNINCSKNGSWQYNPI